MHPDRLAPVPRIPKYITDWLIFSRLFLFFFCLLLPSVGILFEIPVSVCFAGFPFYVVVGTSFFFFAVSLPSMRYSALGFWGGNFFGRFGSSVERVVMVCSCFRRRGGVVFEILIDWRPFFFFLFFLKKPR